MAKKNNNLSILFDLDGTLVNSLPDIAGVVNLVRGKFGLPAFPEQEVRRHIGKGVENLMRGTFPEISSQEYSGLVEEFKAIYYTRPSFGGALYPGVEEGLRALREHCFRIAVVTNKPTLAAESTLRYYLPDFRFDEVAGPEKVSAKKPSPAHALEVIERFGIGKSACWFIGDDQVDYDCALAAGINFLGASYGFGTVKVDPAISLGSFSDIFAKIPNLR